MAQSDVVTGLRLAPCGSPAPTLPLILVALRWRRRPSPNAHAAAQAMRIRKAAQLLLRGRDLGGERLVLGLDAYDEQPHRRIAEIHAAMHDIRPHIICLSGVRHTRLLAG